MNSNYKKIFTGLAHRCNRLIQDEPISLLLVKRCLHCRLDNVVEGARNQLFEVIFPIGGHITRLCGGDKD